MAPSACGANRMSIFKNREASRLAAAAVRKPRPRIQNDRRAPRRLTKSPALMLTQTISIKPSHVWGVCNGVSSRLALTTKAARRESIIPARQTAHIAAPAANDRSKDRNSDLEVNVFTRIVEKLKRLCEAVGPTGLYTVDR